MCVFLGSTHRSGSLGTWEESWYVHPKVLDALVENQKYCHNSACNKIIILYIYIYIYIYI